jgi:alpha-tubulin suppressor-like RCC1 family protein
MRYIAVLMMSLSLSLASCSYFLPSTTPSAFGLLADKGDTRPFEQPLPINTQPKRLALGSDFAIGVKEDGTVWSWGRGGSGVLGTGYLNKETPQPIPNMTDFLEVAVGGEHVLALRKDGTVWSWGDNKKGQLGYKEDGVPYGDPANLQYDPQQLIPKQIPDLKEVVSIAAVGTYSYALSKQGYVYQWGKEQFNNEAIALTNPTKIYKNTDAVKIIATLEGVVVLKKTGKIDLLFQPRGLLASLVSNTRTFLEQGIEVKAFELQLPLPVVSMGSEVSAYYFLLNDGSVYAIGDNERGQLGQGNLSTYKKLVKVKNIGRIVQITERKSIAIDEKGRLWRWGSSIYWRPDLAGGNSNREPYPINTFTDARLAFAVASNYSAALGLNNGEVRFFLGERGGVRGTGKESSQADSTKHLLVPEKSLWTWK